MVPVVWLEGGCVQSTDERGVGGVVDDCACKLCKAIC